MSFEDLVKNFYSVNVCMVRHKMYHPVPWVEHRSRYCTVMRDTICIFDLCKILWEYKAEHAGNATPSAVLALENWWVTI